MYVLCVCRFTHTSLGDGRAGGRKTGKARREREQNFDLFLLLLFLLSVVISIARLP